MRAVQASASGEFEITPIDLDLGAAKCDLTVSLNEQPGALTASFEYSTDLFDQATIVRMAGHWQTILEAVVADPGRPLVEFPILTESERHQILVEWNATATDYPKDLCIHQLFENQVESTPDAIAVIFEDAQIVGGSMWRCTIFIPPDEAKNFYAMGAKFVTLTGDPTIDRQPQI